MKRVTLNITAFLIVWVTSCIALGLGAGLMWRLARFGWSLVVR